MTLSEPSAPCESSRFQAEPVDGRRVSKVIKTTVVHGERMEKHLGDPRFASDLPSAKADFEEVRKLCLRRACEVKGFVMFRGRQPPQRGSSWFIAHAVRCCPLSLGGSSESPSQLLTIWMMDSPQLRQCPLSGAQRDPRREVHPESEEGSWGGCRSSDGH